MSCSMCGARFKSSFELAEHSGVEHGRKRKRCGYCGDYFFALFLQRHIDDNHSMQREIEERVAKAQKVDQIEVEHSGDEVDQKLAENDGYSADFELEDEPVVDQKVQEAKNDYCKSLETFAEKEEKEPVVDQKCQKTEIHHSKDQIDSESSWVDQKMARIDMESLERYTDWEIEDRVDQKSLEVQIDYCKDVVDQKDSDTDDSSFSFLTDQSLVDQNQMDSDDSFSSSLFPSDMEVEVDQKPMDSDTSSSGVSSNDYLEVDQKLLEPIDYTDDEDDDGWLDKYGHFEIPELLVDQILEKAPSCQGTADDPFEILDSDEEEEILMSAEPVDQKMLEIVDLDMEDEEEKGAEPVAIQTISEIPQFFEEEILRMELSLVTPYISSFFTNLFSSSQLQFSKFLATQRIWLLNFINRHLKPFEFKNHPFLLMENEFTSMQEGGKTQCFMNTIVNLLYSIDGFRKMIIGNFVMDEKMTILTSIFLGIFDSGRLWRLTLSQHYHTQQQDIQTVYELLMKNLRTLPLDMLQCTISSEFHCQKCQESKVRGKSVQENSVLKISNFSLLESLETHYAPQPEPKQCAKCSGPVLKTRKVENLGHYHVMMILYQNCDRILDLDWNSVVEMFGAEWRIRSLAQRHVEDLTKPHIGHFMPWIRVDQNSDFICINDSRTEPTWRFPLSALDVKMIVWERV